MAIVGAIAALGLLPPPGHAAPQIDTFGSGTWDGLSIGVDPEGNAYFGDRLAGLARVTRAGEASFISYPHYTPPGQQYPLYLSGISYGPDGALWLTCQTMVCRITLAGERTDFPSAVGGALVGPDGNIWSSNAAGEVLRITPTGGITSLGSIPRPQVVGPDGNFYAVNGSTLWRVSTAGGAQSFPMPAAWPPGGRIVSDGRHGLWVVFNEGIGRIDLEGHVIGGLYTKGLETQPERIVLGSDGNLWYSTYAPRIGRVSPSGRITEFSVGTASYTTALLIGASSTAPVLWAGDNTNGTAWRFTFRPPRAVTDVALVDSPTQATLHGAAAPEGAAATVRFEYGPTDRYGAATPEQDAGDGDDTTPLDIRVPGLTPATTYHYRLVVTTPVGTAYGADRTFATAATTGPPPPGTTVVAVSQPDADRDGYPETVDCDDRNPARHPGATDRPGDRVDQDCDGSDATWPKLTPHPDAIWDDAKGGTIVFTRLTLDSVPAGATITLTCAGKGCRWQRWSKKVGKTTAKTNLLGRLRGSHLHRGARLELRVTRPGTTGRLIRWSVGRQVRRTTLCLPPGSRKGVVC
jgi:Putative metal-binding motif